MGTFFPDQDYSLTQFSYWHFLIHLLLFVEFLPFLTAAMIKQILSVSSQLCQDPSLSDQKVSLCFTPPVFVLNQSTCISI